jgi:hypothetical protein
VSNYQLLLNRALPCCKPRTANRDRPRFNFLTAAVTRFGARLRSRFMIDSASPIAGDFAAVLHSACLLRPSGSNSVVESQLPKLLVAGSIPVSRSKVDELRFADLSQGKSAIPLFVWINHHPAESSCHGFRGRRPAAGPVQQSRPAQMTSAPRDSQAGHATRTQSSGLQPPAECQSDR